MSDLRQNKTLRMFRKQLLPRLKTGTAKQLQTDLANGTDLVDIPPDKMCDGRDWGDRAWAFKIAQEQAGRDRRLGNINWLIHGYRGGLPHLKICNNIR